MTNLRFQLKAAHTFCADTISVLSRIPFSFPPFFQFALFYAYPTNDREPWAVAVSWQAIGVEIR